MKLGMINSAWEQHGVGLVDGLERTKSIGFDCVDIFHDPLDPGSNERLKLVKKSCERLQLPVVSVVGVSLGLIDFNPSVRKFHLERSKAYLDMGAELQARNYLLVLGEYLWQREVIPPEEQWNWAVECVRELGQHARSLGLEVVLELEPFKLSLLKNIDAMARFLEDVDESSVRANIDISHMVLSGVMPDRLELLRGRAGHVHISDCDGKVHGDLPPGRGVVDFPPYLEAIKKLDFDGVVSIELEYSPDPERIVEWVEEAYAATVKLMDDAGLRG